MRITSIRLSGFRCFGAEGTTITLQDLTAFVGTNGCGKSAVLLALARLFGTSSSERTILREDFHVPPGSTLDEVGETSLSIEARLDFPELEAADEEPSSAEALENSGVSDCFAQMAVASEGETPYCRIRLEADWAPSQLPEGEVVQSLVWLTTADEEPAEEDKPAVRAVDRSRIQVHYVPAARDPVRQIRQVSGSLLHHILRAVRWTDEVKEQVENGSKEAIDAFAGEEGVELIQSALQEHWDALHPSKAYGKVAIRPTAKRFEELLRQVEAVFSPAPAGGEYPVDRLSDGLKSLFYLTIVATAFDIYGSALASTDADAESAFVRHELSPPTLMVFAIEEPENHLAPHYLGRIVGLLRKMAGAAHGQVMLTSHSASIMSRVEPEEVRYLRLLAESGTTAVREITLPDDEDAARTFVREAVRAHPELYFARLVVLGEGDSEEIVLPRVAEAFGLAIDPGFVSIVPLGGRHVNHFWKLLADLAIPHVTLLDLDMERSGGGWGRIKYACKQLLSRGIDRDELLETSDGTALTPEAFEKMHTWKADRETLGSWATALEKYNVFFSAPLDLDFMMLQALEAQYKATATDGPDIPEEPEKYAKALASVLSGVLKEKHTGGALYVGEEQKLFFWYRYLFLNRGKPTSHLASLAGISAEDLKASTPAVLKRLVKRMKKRLAEPAEAEIDAG